MSDSNKRYEIRSCVCDWAIWDNEKSSFIYQPMSSYREATRILDHFLALQKDKEKNKKK